MYMYSQYIKLASPLPSQSANKYISQNSLQASGKSFIYITNNNGPKTLPCGIPLVKFCHSEYSLFILTLCFLSFKYYFIQFIYNGCMPYCFNLNINLL